MRNIETLSAFVFRFSIASLLLPLSIGFLFLKFDSPTYFTSKNLKFFTSKFPNQKWDGIDCAKFRSLEGDTSCSVIKYGTPLSKVILWGDSHALALKKYKPNLHNIELIIIGHSGCPPITNVVRFDGVGNSINCSSPQTLKNYLDWINDQKPDKVFLVGRWSLYIEGWIREGSLQRAHHFLKAKEFDEQKILSDKDTRLTILSSGLLRTLGSIKANEVYIIDQPMDFSEIGFRSMYRSLSFPRDKLVNYNSSRFNMFKNLGFGRVIDIPSLFCDVKECYVRRDGILIYDDDNHLSSYGAKLVWDELMHTIGSPTNLFLRESLKIAPSE